jgi:hypothetical protein
MGVSRAANRDGAQILAMAMPVTETMTVPKAILSPLCARLAELPN